MDPKDEPPQGPDESETTTTNTPERQAGNNDGNKPDESSEGKENEGDNESPASAEVSTEIPSADTIIQLGDLIEIQGGAFDGRKGKVVYRDVDKILVLPEGGANVPYSIPLDEEGDIDSSLAIENINITKHPLNKFVFDEESKEWNLQTAPFVIVTDLSPDQTVTTYKSDGSLGPVFKVKSVDVENDTADFLDISDKEDPTDYPTIEFSYIGIPEDQPFVYFSNRFATAASTENVREAEEGKEEEAAANEDESLLGDDDIELLDTTVVIQKPRIAETAQGKDIEYDDKEQRSEMFNDLMKKKGLTEADLKHPRRIKQNKILMEQLFALRNDLVNYLPNGRGIDGKKLTSFSTLSDILKEVKIPLAVPVVDAKRTLYYDHSSKYYEDLATGGEGSDKTESTNTDIQIKFLADTIEGSIDYIKKNMSGVLPSEEKTALETVGLPALYAEFQNLFNNYFPHLTLKGSPNSSTLSDSDVFRGDIPKTEEERGTIGGLPKLRINEKGILESNYDVPRIKSSRLRSISSRSTAMRNGEKQTIESADLLNIVFYMFFPFLYLREFGSTRSGDLALDIAQSMNTMRTTNTILSINGPIRAKETKESGDTTESYVDPDKILPVQTEGSVLSNLSVAEWLAGQPIFGRGFGDLFALLSSLGLRNKELNVEQIKVLTEKVTQYRSAIRKFLNDERAKAEDEAGKQTVQINNLLDAKTVETLFKSIQGEKREAILQRLLMEFAERIPAYKESDIARFAYLYKLYPDLLQDTIAGQPTKENIRALRQIILTNRKNQMLQEYLKKTAGKEPVPNTCEHVEQYNLMKKVKNLQQRMELLNRFISRYRQEKKDDHWLWCKICNKHLMCEHEFLQIKEYMMPLKAKQYHKELLLTFNDGIFMGQYACKNCGQSISEIEFDNHMEFNDDGKPISGRSALEDKEQEIKDELERALDLKPAVAVQEIKFGTEREEVFYRVLRRLTDMLGIQMEEEAYRRLVTHGIQVYKASVVKQKDYAKKMDALKKEAEKKEDPKQRAALTAQAGQSYEAYVNRLLVAVISSELLLEMQTHVPEYKVEFTLDGCTASFEGYPLVPKVGDKPPETMGIDYIACAIASITEDEDPWNKTTFQEISNDKDRRQKIGQSIYNFIRTSFLERADVQQMLETKRNFLTEKFGRAPGSTFLKEILPDGFVPSQLVIPVEEAAKKPFIDASAKGSNRAFAWILLAHDLARSGAKLSRTSKQIAISCCYDKIMTPMKYWQDKGLPSLGAKSSPLGGRGSLMRLPMTLRPEISLFAKINETNMKKLFVKVCFDGPRKGYPHEPGYDLRCPYCGYQFPYDPRDPIFPIITKEILDQKPKYDKMIEMGLQAAEEQRRADEERSLELSKVAVNAKTFNELLDTMHEHYLVDPVKRPKIRIVNIALLEDFLTIPVLPFKEKDSENVPLFMKYLRTTIENLKVEMAKKSVSEAEIVQAYRPISEKANEFGENLVGLLKDNDAYNILMKLFDGIQKGESASRLAQTLHSFFLLPIQRALTHIDKSILINPPKSLKLGPVITDDIRHILDQSTIVFMDFHEDYNSYKKLQDARNSLAALIPRLQNKVRVNTVPGSLAAYADFVKYLVLGIFTELLDDTVLPSDYEKKRAKFEEKDTKNLKKFVVEIISAMKSSAINFTDKQIRDIIEQRNEEDRRTILGRIKKLPDVLKPLEMQKKKLGVGDWAVGGTKAIYTYNEDQYVREKIQREQINKGDDEVTDEVDPDMITEEEEYEIDAGYDVGDAQDHEDEKNIEENAGGVHC